MPVVKIYVGGSEKPGRAVEIEAAANSLLSDLISNAEPDFFLPCGGRQSCGKCLVWIKGDTAPPREAELEFLSRRQSKAVPPAADYILRLACACRIKGNCVVILAANEKDGLAVAPYTSKRLSYDGTGENDLGICVDIGTTTITALLYNLAEGRLLASASEMNRQGIFGADVISRINYSNSNGIDELANIIKEQLNGLNTKILADAGEQASAVKRIVITGNATMLHYLAGLDPKGIGEAPFATESLFGISIDAGRVLSGFSAGTQIYLPPCIGPYIGADISNGIQLIMQNGAENWHLLVDVGTNGEMALMLGERVICCSALLTTTMNEMKSVVECVKESGLDVKVMVGGAPVTQGFCDEIGADAYTADAASAADCAIGFM